MQRRELIVALAFGLLVGLAANAIIGDLDSLGL
jgi:hypothetical protein